jgi:hypothetical protein
VLALEARHGGAGQAARLRKERRHPALRFDASTVSDRAGSAKISDEQTLFLLQSRGVRVDLVPPNEVRMPSSP